MHVVEKCGYGREGVHKSRKSFKDGPFLIIHKPDGKKNETRETYHSRLLEYMDMEYEYHDTTQCIITIITIA